TEPGAERREQPPAQAGRLLYRGQRRPACARAGSGEGQSHQVAQDLGEKAQGWQACHAPVSDPSNQVGPLDGLLRQPRGLPFARTGGPVGSAVSPSRARRIHSSSRSAGSSAGSWFAIPPPSPFPVPALPPPAPPP